MMFSSLWAVTFFFTVLTFKEPLASDDSQPAMTVVGLVDAKWSQCTLLRKKKKSEKQSVELSGALSPPIKGLFFYKTKGKAGQEDVTGILNCSQNSWILKAGSSRCRSLSFNIVSLLTSGLILIPSHPSFPCYESIFLPTRTASLSASGRFPRGQFVAKHSCHGDPDRDCGLIPSLPRAVKGRSFSSSPVWKDRRSHILAHTQRWITADRSRLWWRSR